MKGAGTCSIFLLWGRESWGKKHQRFYRKLWCVSQPRYNGSCHTAVDHIAKPRQLAANRYGYGQGCCYGFGGPKRQLGWRPFGMHIWSEPGATRKVKALAGARRKFFFVTTAELWRNLNCCFWPALLFPLGTVRRWQHCPACAEYLQGAKCKGNFYYIFPPLAKMH